MPKANNGRANSKNNGKGPPKQNGPRKQGPRDKKNPDRRNFGPSQMESLRLAIPQLPSFKARKGKGKGKGKGGGMQLSIAAAKYAAAVLNPFSIDADSAYIPLGNGRGTQKVKVVSKFETFIGTQGIGWILISPCLANDSIVAWNTNASYSGISAVPYLTALTNTLNAGVETQTIETGYTQLQLRSPYATSGQNPSIFGRVVSCTVTVHYVGTTLNQGGLAYCFTDPDHESLVGSTSGTLGRRLDCDISNITRDKCVAVDYSLIETETFFERNAEVEAAGVNTAVAPFSSPLVVPVYPFSNGQTCSPDSAGLSVFGAPGNKGAPTMCVFLSGLPANQVHVEIIEHLEFQGTLAEGKMTATPVDRLGYETVTAGLGAAMSQRNSQASLADSFMRGCKLSTDARRPASSAAISNIMNMSGGMM